MHLAAAPFRPLRALVLAAALALLATTITAPPASAAPPRVTLFGDSVQASFGFSSQAERTLGAGLRLRVEAEVCRSLVSRGCLGGQPPSALAVAEALGGGLGLSLIHISEPTRPTT